jgi:hypothetical protein
MPVFPDGFAGRRRAVFLQPDGVLVCNSIGPLCIFTAWSNWASIGRLMAENVGIMVVYGTQTEHQRRDDERRFFAHLHRVAALRV